MTYRVYHLAELLPTAVAQLQGAAPEPSAPNATLHARIADAPHALRADRAEVIQARTSRPRRAEGAS